MSTIAPRIDAATPSPASPAPAKRGKHDDMHFGFDDIIDIVNPLQHLPVIGTLYRRLTGDTMSPTSEIAGGALFGGAMGALSSLANVLWTQATGKDIANTVLGWVGLDDKKADVQTAQAPREDIGHRVLGWLGIGGKKAADVQVAEAPVSAPKPFEAGAQPRQASGSRLLSSFFTQAEDKTELSVLVDAMESEGIAPDAASRAARAYRNAIGLTDMRMPELAPIY